MRRTIFCLALILAGLAPANAADHTVPYARTENFIEEKCTFVTPDTWDLNGRDGQTLESGSAQAESDNFMIMAVPRHPMQPMNSPVVTTVVEGLLDDKGIAMTNQSVTQMAGLTFLVVDGYRSVQNLYFRYYLTEANDYVYIIGIWTEGTKPQDNADLKGLVDTFKLSPNPSLPPPATGPIAMPTGLSQVAPPSGAGAPPSGASVPSTSGASAASGPASATAAPPSSTGRTALVVIVIVAVIFLVRWYLRKHSPPPIPSARHSPPPLSTAAHESPPPLPGSGPENPPPTS